MQAGGSEEAGPSGESEKFCMAPAGTLLIPASDKQGPLPVPPTARGSPAPELRLPPWPSDPLHVPACVPSPAASHGSRWTPHPLSLAGDPRIKSRPPSQPASSTSPLHEEPSTLIPEPVGPYVCSGPTSGPLHGLSPLPVFTCGSVLGLYPHFQSTHSMSAWRPPLGCSPGRESKPFVHQIHDDG